MTILQFFLRIQLYGGLLAAAFGITFYNVAHGSTQANYFSETPQNVLLLGIVTAGVLMARHRSGARAIGVALALFFTACAVREFDNELDALLYKGAWKLPVGALGVALLAYAVRQWGRIRDELAHYGNTLGFGVFVVGLLQLMVFSRLWGGNDLWRLLMAGGFDRTLVRVSEEGIELMAYTVILIGVVELYWESRRASRPPARPPRRGRSDVA